jgi:ZU5 domain
MRKFATSVLAVLAIGIGGCSDARSTAPTAPVAPDAPREGLLLGFISTSTTLRRATRLERDITVGARIGSEGGVIAIPEAGLRLVVPAGAVAAPTDFSATAVQGRAVAYEFQPHGVRFAKPLVLTQELRGTEWFGIPLLDFRAGYFTDRTKLDTENATAQLAEILPLSLDLLRLQARFDVPHFSGYVISTGRARSSELDTD